MFGPVYKHMRQRPLRDSAGTGSDMPCRDDQMRGITSGTRIATADGWRTVDALTIGDRIPTLDSGPQNLVAITRATRFVRKNTPPDFASPVHVPAGVIGNSEPMVLLPEQMVMIESDEALARTGDPFALVPAKALVGYREAERFRALRSFEVFTLHFRNDEMIYVDGGALVLAQAAVPGEIVPPDAFARPTPYAVFRGRQAGELVAALAEESEFETGQAATYAAAA